jgi:hypothetical protein
MDTARTAPWWSSATSTMNRKRPPPRSCSARLGQNSAPAGADRPDKGDAFRLWNLASLIAEDRRYSRVYRGRKELIDHILVSHALRDRVQEVRSVIDHPLPSVNDTPGERRDAVDSDHAPVLARIDL